MIRIFNNVYFKKNIILINPSLPLKLHSIKT